MTLLSEQCFQPGEVFTRQNVTHECFAMPRNSEVPIKGVGNSNLPPRARQLLNSRVSIVQNFSAESNTLKGCSIFQQ
jgi:hypothetical protein